MPSESYHNKIDSNPETFEIGFKTGKGNLIPVKKQILDKVKVKFFSEDDCVESKDIESSSTTVS